MSRPPPRATLTDSLSPSTTLFRSRARLRYPDLRAPGGKIDVQGFTLPGLPAVVVGSNGHVAWAFTNSYVDSTDWKRVVPCAPAKPATASCRPITTHRETIDVAGTDAVALTVEDAAWGPILEHESRSEEHTSELQSL